MSQTERQMRLGLFIQAAGHHSAGWRYPGAESGSENFPLIRRLTLAAEKAKLDMVFFGDKLVTGPKEHPSMIVRLEPVALLGALAAITERIGLVATASTTYSEPYTIARQFATIDHLSAGRAGWNVVTTGYDSAANFTRATHPDHAQRYAVAEEFVDVVRGLWDSWEEGAYVRDSESGVYLDPEKLHSLDHKGEFFSIAGPLNLTRAPQGHPVLVQAGSSGPGMALAARIGEVVFTAQQGLEEAGQFYRDLKAQVVAQGRSPDHCLVMPGVMPILGKTAAQAQARFDHLQSWTDQEAALLMVADRLGQDLSGFDLDQPLPDLPLPQNMQSRARLLLDLSHRDGLTLRQICNLAAGARGHKIVVGTPQRVADELIAWFEGGAADGFNLMPAYFPEGLDDFIEGVLPILRKHKLFREEYSGSTLREHLGLPVPENRYT
ncbi:LLM class flavin-dependent oxidoreductase [Pseudomonas sp. KFB-139]|uniref:LLM class flavin-dependent oxidoreductase n=1 Tax=Pseudomonas serbiensis TaxID=3064350 RepID=A0ABT9CN24_9PSED|nr:MULTISPECIES: LLM class flavin-dependent oxidoreductase [Pseudomonas]MDO7926895.1 LLM class flavin-dependent oxidoreductase [Pseudomonas sp. KFB-138]